MIDGPRVITVHCGRKKSTDLNNLWLSNEMIEKTICWPKDFANSVINIGTMVEFMCGIKNNIP